MRGPVFLAIAGLSLLAQPTLSPAQTAIVRQDGIAENDTYETITAAIAAAENSGYTEIVVYPGSYRENLDIAIAGLTIRSLDGPLLTCLDGSGSSTSTDATVAVESGVSLTMIGLNIGGAGYGAFVPNSADMTLRNCVIEGNYIAGVYAEYTDRQTPITRVLLDNCVIINNHGDGISLNTGSNTEVNADHLFYASVRNCIVMQSQGYGINLPGDSQYADSTISRVQVSYNLFQENVIAAYSPQFTTTGESFRVPFSATNLTEASADLLLSATGCGADVRLQSTSGAVNTGNPGSQFRDPDGTRNDMGVFGGPFAENYFTDLDGGPVVRDVEGPTTIRQSDRTFTIRAKAAIR